MPRFKSFRAAAAATAALLASAVVTVGGISPASAATATANDDAFTYSTGWNEVNTAGATEHWSAVANSTATINFAAGPGGTTFTLKGVRDPSNHDITIAIDGGTPATLSQSGTRVYGQSFGTSPTVAEGNHTAVVKVASPEASITGAALSNGTFGGPGFSTAPAGNTGPTSAFSASTLTVAFDASAATDPDGTITSYDWNFGDNTTGTGKTPSHTYVAAGAYAVRLTATDDKGAVTTSQQNVTVAKTTASQAGTSVAAPTTPTTPPTTPPSTTSPSGVTMPTGNVTSNGRTWTQSRAEDFTSASAIGQPNSTGSSFELYPDGSGDGKYRHNNVTVQDGKLRIQVREQAGADTGAAGALFGWGHTGPKRFEVRFRADSSAGGYGSAIQLWPSSNVWNEGEMDFPEGDFGGQINLYHHEVGPNPGNNYLVASNLGSWNTWHTAVIEWVPNSSVRYYLDGNLVGQVTDPAQVATAPHNWIVQAASHGGDVPSAVSGYLEIDWARTLAG